MRAMGNKGGLELMMMLAVLFICLLFLAVLCGVASAGQLTYREELLLKVPKQCRLVNDKFRFGGTVSWEVRQKGPHGPREIITINTSGIDLQIVYATLGIKPDAVTVYALYYGPHGISKKKKFSGTFSKHGTLLADREFMGKISRERLLAEEQNFKIDIASVLENFRILSDSQLEIFIRHRGCSKIP